MVLAMWGSTTPLLMIITWVVEKYSKISKVLIVLNGIAQLSFVAWANRKWGLGLYIVSPELCLNMAVGGGDLFLFGLTE